MSMTKKEQARLAEALEAAALRTTADVFPDVAIPKPMSSTMHVGYTFIGSHSDWPRVVDACSTSIYHSTSSVLKTDAQGGIELFSEKILALRALRREVEKHCAQRLRKIDVMIETELSASSK